MSWWVDTRQKVIAHQRRQVTTWFVKHPLTFGAAYGLKGLTWDLPKWGVRSLAGVKTKKVQKADGGGVTTVIEHIDADGNISESRVTRTVQNGPVSAAIADGPVHRPQPVKAPVAPITPEERIAVVKSSKQLLTRTPLGKAFVLLAGELDGFAPVRGAEAVSTAHMTQQLSTGARRIAMGTEAFGDVVAECGLNRRITGHINAATTAVDTAAKAMQRANRLVESLYDGQITQDMSRANSISAVPVRTGTGDEAAGIGPHSVQIGNFYGLFEPEVDKEATQVYAYLRISQAGFALVSDMLSSMPRRLHHHGIDRRVVRTIESVAGTTLEAAEGFAHAMREMKILYQGQMAHEATGVSTIRTAPMRTTGA